MNFEFPPEIEDARRRAMEFARKHITPELAVRYDEEEHFPDEIRKLAYAEKLIDFSNPWSMLVTIEELCRVDPGVGIAATVGLFGSEIIMLFGTDRQKEKYLSRVQKGEAIMGLAVTEPGGGSDVAGLKTEATDRGDYYEINGSKMFITNGQIADFFVMLVRTSRPDSKRHHGLSVLIVDANQPGFKRNKLTGKLGVRATNTAELILENVKVPKENLVGEEGKGFYYVMTFFNISRVYVAAQAIGIAQGSFDRLLEYYGKLSSSGVAISEDAQFAIADVATRIEASRLLTYKASSYLFQFKPNPTLTSMAKAYASETASYAAEKALTYTGSAGLFSEIERFYRDAKIMEIWEGTTEVEKLIISRNLVKEGAQQ
ncbi:MAG TPA: acyl-CoA dehydrogenase family protein [Thermoplasmataceae archaeon]|nr:acyl-CoA dehydrogenase family protein [Thermoplasmatales archaeon AK]HLH85237.1 acyl-CoA dehydrogenase family protein [Thermoplasmataceae archaeon]